MELDKLLTCIDSETEQAKQKFEFIYSNLIGFFKKQENLFALPEDCANDTMIRVAGSIRDCQAINNLSAYIFGFAWNVLHEKQREEKKRPVSLEKILAGGEQFRADTDEDERNLARRKKQRLKYMQECLDRRPKNERLLLQEYVKAKTQDAVGVLAERLQTSISALRTKIHRIREELKLCVKARQKNGDR